MLIINVIYSTKYQIYSALSVYLSSLKLQVMCVFVLQHSPDHVYSVGLKCKLQIIISLMMSDKTKKI